MRKLTNSETLRVQARQFVQSCDLALNRLKTATADLTARERDITSERLSRWVKTGAWKTVNTLLQVDSLILARLRDLASRKEAIDNSILARCRSIVDDVGRPALALAESFPSMMVRQSLTLRQSRAYDKAVFRALARTHWHLLGNLIKTRDAIYAEVKEPIESLTRALEDVGWLFVIFVCYARENAVHLNDLIRLSQRHLKEDHVVLWWDNKTFEKDRAQYWWQRRIIGASDWDRELMDHLAEVDLGVVLVSKPFFSSKYIGNHELPKMVKRQKKEGMRIFPIILDNYKYDRKKYDWLDATQWLPGGGRTVQRDYTTELDLKRLYAEEFVREIRIIIDELSDPEKAIKP